MRIRFLTSTPLNIALGSGTYVGIAALGRALRALGHDVRIDAPTRRLPIYTLDRLLYNLRLRPDDSDLTVGFDLDGYTIAAPGRAHVAALKGVIADEARFETGATRATMRLQSRWERLHVLRAERVITDSRYSAAQAQILYGLSASPRVVPELIELGEWRRLLAEHPARERGGFTVLFVGRLYKRKRVHLLLEAAAQLRDRIPSLAVRIVGEGPRAAPLRALWRELRLESVVEWLGSVSRAQLTQEYRDADVFCLPSVQEAFGIVLLEAMAAGKPVVAARAGAIPEVAPDAMLVEPESAAALADGIEQLYRDRDVAARIAALGVVRVEAFDAPRVAQMFLDAATGP